MKDSETYTFKPDIKRLNMTEYSPNSSINKSINSNRNSFKVEHPIYKEIEYDDYSQFFNFIYYLLIL